MQRLTSYVRIGNQVLNRAKILQVCTPRKRWIYWRFPWALDLEYARRQPPSYVGPSGSGISFLVPMQGSDTTWFTLRYESQSAAEQDRKLLLSDEPPKTA